MKTFLTVSACVVSLNYAWGVTPLIVEANFDSSNSTLSDPNLSSELLDDTNSGGGAGGLGGEYLRWDNVANVGGTDIDLVAVAQGYYNAHNLAVNGLGPSGETGNINNNTD